MRIWDGFKLVVLEFTLSQPIKPRAGLTNRSQPRQVLISELCRFCGGDQEFLQIIFFCKLLIYLKPVGKYPFDPFDAQLVYGRVLFEVPVDFLANAVRKRCPLLGCLQDRG